MCFTEFALVTSSPFQSFLSASTLLMWTTVQIIWKYWEILTMLRTCTNCMRVQTVRVQNEVRWLLQIRNKENSFRAGVSNIRPADRIRSTKAFHAVRDYVAEYNKKTLCLSKGTLIKAFSKCTFRMHCTGNYKYFSH